MADLRAAVHAKLSEESLAGWHAFADQHGTTVSALLEVIGLELGEVIAGTISDPQPVRLDRMAGRARELSQARKRRRPEPKKARRRRPD